MAGAVAEKLRTDDLPAPLAAKLNRICSVVCVIASIWAVTRNELVGTRPPLEEKAVRWCLQLTGNMVLAALFFEVSFVGSVRWTGMRPLYAGFESRLNGLRLAKKMIVLYLALTVAYNSMALDMHWVHENRLAQSVGHRGSVYTARYIEWVLATPILVSVSGHLEAGPDGRPRNGLAASALGTGAYIMVAWIALVVKDVWTAWSLVALAFVAYLLASWEQLVFAWYIRDKGRAGPVRCLLLLGLVLIFGIYGAIYLSAVFGVVSPEFEQKFYSLGDVSAKMTNSALLILVRQMEDMSIVEDLRVSAVTVADDVSRLITTASVPIFGIDTECRINEWNDKIAELTGLPAKRAQGMAFLDLLQDTSRVTCEQVIRSSLEGKRTTTCEIRIKAKGQDKSEKVKASRQATLVVSASPKRDRHGRVVGVIGVGHDLTEIRAVKEAEARKSRFMAVVSHELRSPLHGIIGLSDNLGINEPDPGRAKQLQMVRNCAARLLDLVVNIMEMASATALDETGRPKAPKKLSRDPVELVRIIEEVVLLVRSATDKHGNPLVKKGVTLSSEVQGNLPIIEADAHKCTQVFYNIITNACKFTKSGQITIFSKADRAGQWVEIGVADTGKGIAPESQERIFQPFEQEDSSEMRQYEGIGLGLSIAQEVVQRHGGSITLESEVGIGTTFIVRLPVAMAAAEEAGAAGGDESLKPLAATQPQAAPPAPPAMPAAAVPAHEACEEKRPTRPCSTDFRSTKSVASEGSPMRRKPLVLSVDDDIVNQTVIQGALSEEYDIHAAMDGQECLDYFSTHSRLPDVVLLDVMMPGMTGFEVCRRIREDLALPSTALPIVMLSARAPIGASVIEGLQNGCNDYISKPFEKEVLRARVKAALHMKRLHEVELENAKQTELLYSIMPPHIIERLQAGENMIAESHESVTLLFSDIVGWTNIAESLTTSQVVVLLNELFSAFDELTEEHDVYKVETIGDAYMCAAGHDGSKDHAVRIVKFGLAMVQAATRVRPPSAGLRLQIRVGAHTGPAYTGVVGRKVPRYCFFGDTVNVSSRMESHGMPSCVHISQSTRDALGSAAALGEGVQIVERGTVEIKGKGAMTTHLILPPGATAPSASPPHKRRQAALAGGPEGGPSRPAMQRTASASSTNLPPLTPRAEGSPAQQQELEACAERLQAERQAVEALREELESARASAEAGGEALASAKSAAEREVGVLERARLSEVAACKDLRGELAERSDDFKRRLCATVEELAARKQQCGDLEERLGAASLQSRALEERVRAASLQSSELEERLAEANSRLAAEKVLEGRLLAMSGELAAGQEHSRTLREKLFSLEVERRETSALESEAAMAEGDAKEREFQQRLDALEVDRRALREANAQLLQRVQGLPSARPKFREAGSVQAEAVPLEPCVSTYLRRTPTESSDMLHGDVAAPARIVEAKELQVRHLRLELKLKDQKLQVARAALAAKVADLEAKDMELQHALLDLRTPRR